MTQKPAQQHRHNFNGEHPKSLAALSTVHRKGEVSGEVVVEEFVAYGGPEEAVVAGLMVRSCFSTRGSTGVVRL